MRLAVTIIFIGLFIAVAVGVLALFLSSFGQGTGGDTEEAEGPTEAERIQISHDGGKTFAAATISSEAKKILSSASPIALFEDSDVAGRWWLPTNAAIFLSQDTGASWDMLRNEQNEMVSGATAFAREPGSDTLYLANIVDDRGRIFRSDDLGKTFVEVFSAAQTKVTISAIAVDPAEHAHILAGMSDGFSVVSRDRGNTWTTLGSFSGTIDRIVFSPKDPASVFMTIVDKGLLYSGDRGETWGNVDVANLSQFRGGNAIFDVSFFPGAANQVLLATEAGLLASDDTGSFRLVGSLVVPPKSLPILSIVFNPRNAAEAYVTARNGLYKSENTGETWEVVRLSEDKDLRFVRMSRDIPQTVVLFLTPAAKEAKNQFRIF